MRFTTEAQRAQRLTEKHYKLFVVLCCSSLCPLCLCGKAIIRPRRDLRSEIPPRRLLPLDGLEQRPEVALAEAPGALALDDLVEHRRPVLDRLGEDLQQVPGRIPVHQ